MGIKANLVGRFLGTPFENKKKTGFMCKFLTADDEIYIIFSQSLDFFKIGQDEVEVEVETSGDFLFAR